MGLTLEMEVQVQAQHGKPTALYRFYDQDHALLYVGIAVNPKTRWAIHAGEKTWWPDVAKKTVVWYSDRSVAELAEVEAIRSEMPRYNVTHSRTRRPGDARKETRSKYTPIRRLRESDCDWAAFGDAARAAGTTRNALLREFICWYLRSRKSQMPERPAAGTWSRPAA